MKQQETNHKIIFTVKDIATIGMMAAMLETVKFVFQSIPNVEFVTLFIILFTLYLGPKTLVSVWAFVGLECVVWGFGLWTIMYFYIWPILVILTLLLRKSTSSWPFVVLATCFGLFFGALCTIPYFFIGGVSTAFAWWVAGIPYDILHGISNGIGAFILFRPLNHILTRVKNETLNKRD
ncbi:MAG: hypothetical protein K6E13_07190 [Lachnospiraceae bacterium]|nr:hypothetical protein [Lachnospiraceae bacterium]